MLNEPPTRSPSDLTVPALPVPDLTPPAAPPNRARKPRRGAGLALGSGLGTVAGAVAAVPVTVGLMTAALIDDDTMSVGDWISGVAFMSFVALPIGGFIGLVAGALLGSALTAIGRTESAPWCAAATATLPGKALLIAGFVANELTPISLAFIFGMIAAHMGIGYFTGQVFSQSMREMRSTRSR